MKLKLFFTTVFAVSYLQAGALEEYIDFSKCDQIVNKKSYQVCYSYANKGALSGWVKLNGTTVNQVNIKQRPKFYGDKLIPVEYRTEYKDYTGYGKNWNRGHFIVADADLDHNEEQLNLAYSMANIIPQSAMMNQRTWTKVEAYTRELAQEFGYIMSLSIAKYENPNNKIGNDIVIPSTIYRVLYNNDKGFEKCYKYENILEVDTKNDTLESHEVDCGELKLL